MASAGNSKLRNIGPVASQWLAEVGVTSWEDLDRLGVVQVYAMVQTQQHGASLNLLWALEGAHRKIDWRKVTPEDKQRLRQQIEQLTS